MLFFELHSRNVVGRIIGKLSERKLVTSLLASWKTAGKLHNNFEVHSSLIFSENPWSLVFSAATNCSNSFKSSISMFDFPKEENDKTFTPLYGVRTISQKTILNKISRQVR